MDNVQEKDTFAHMKDLEKEGRERKKLMAKVNQASKDAVKKIFNGKFELGISDETESRKAIELLCLKLKADTGIITNESFEQKLEKAFEYTYDTPYRIVDLVRKGSYDSNPVPKIRKECFEWIRDRCANIGNFEFYPYKIVNQNDRIVFGVNKGYFVDQAGTVLLDTKKYGHNWELTSLETMLSIVQFIQLSMYKEI